MRVSSIAGRTGAEAFPSIYACLVRAYQYWEKRDLMYLRGFGDVGNRVKPVKIPPCEGQPEIGNTRNGHSLRAFISLPTLGGVFIVDGSRKPSPITIRLASEP